MLKAIIIEDEIANRINLKSLLHRFCPGEVEIIGEAGSVETAIALANKTLPDLIFLDVQLAGGNGFEVLDNLLESHRFQVIFVTSYDEYAIQAIKYSALDYLVKPIDVDELIFSVQKARDAHTMALSPLQASQHSFSRRNSISIPTRNGLIILRIDHIIHCTAEGSYSKLFLVHERPLIVSKNLKELETQLPKAQFFRTHRSHLINLAQVKSFLHANDSSVIVSNGDKIPVSRRRRKPLFSILLNGGQGPT